MDRNNMYRFRQMKNVSPEIDKAKEKKCRKCEKEMGGYKRKDILGGEIEREKRYIWEREGEKERERETKN